MAKKVVGYIKLNILAGKATPAPPIGPALGQKGVNIMAFCKDFNAKTQGLPADMPVRVVIEVYADKSYSFVMMKPPVTYYLKQAVKIKKGSSSAGRSSDIAVITEDQLREIARDKMVDMNAYDVEQAISMLAGSARSMGIRVEANVGEGE